MSKSNADNRRLQREIVAVIVFKLILLVLIWQFFFSANRVDVNPQAAEQHLLSAPSSANSQAEASSD
ncbi:MAG: hypothetical protein Q4G42_00670 [Neisseria sp.]|nr:hypothetical protein [Neisseria sp.]